LQQIENEILDKNSQIFFMCKTGGRSLDAAIFATEIGGYKNCFNITNGFEGDANENNQRGKINGWKALNLPWLQA
jgi:rhodanese-related sulfurtransferase